MPSFSKGFSLIAGTTIVQPALGAHLGNGLFANNSNPYPSLRAHYDGFNTAMGRVATVIPAVGANDTTSFQAGSSPNTWGGGDAQFWAGIPLPVDGNTFPQLTWAFSDGSIDNNFALFAPGTGGLPTSLFAGQTMDHWIQANLQTWRNVAPFKKIYVRINWEFNQGGPNPPTTHFEVPSSGQVAAWLNAWRGFANSAHTWGNANNCQVRICWCPTTPNGVANAAFTFGQAVSNFFPFPDANAVNGRYIDVVCPDVYAIASAFGTTGVNTIWCFDNYVKIAQTANANIGVAELGDFLNQTAWQQWIPSQFTPYLNNLKNLSPAVPIELMSLYDISGIGQAFCFSVLDPNGSNDCNAWRTALGSGAAVTTIPPI
jgi:hypothetical protein